MRTPNGAVHLPITFIKVCNCDFLHDFSLVGKWGPCPHAFGETGPETDVFNSDTYLHTYAQAVVGENATSVRHKRLEDVRQLSHVANEQQLIAHNVPPSSRLESATDLVRALIDELTSGKDVFSKSIVLTLAKQLMHTDVHIRDAHEHQRAQLIALFNSISPAVQVCASTFD